MVVNKRKKFTRHRASFTHGGGSKKKRRGAGNRGGIGMSGTGKRSDQKKPRVWKNQKYFGKHGFSSQHKGEQSINIDDMLILLNKSDSQDTIDLTKTGYHKLLGRGSLTQKVTITVHTASKQAAKKISEAGGTLKLSPKKENGPVQNNTE